MSELKPCPFCGGEAEMLTAESMNGGYLFGIMCNDCRSRGDVYDTEAEAIEAWNTRYHSEFEKKVIKAWKEIQDYTERTCKNDDNDCDAWFKCSECGLHSKLEIMSGGYGIPNYCPNCGAKVVEQ